MSALAKPMIFSANVSNLVGSQSQPVPAEHIINIAKIDLPATPGVEAARYHITFDILSSENQPRKITWKYTDSGDRDTDYDDVVAAVGASI